MRPDPREFTFEIEPGLRLAENPEDQAVWLCRVRPFSLTQTRKQKPLVSIVAATPEKAFADALWWIESGQPAPGQSVPARKS